MLDSRITWEVEHKLTMLLEGLLGQNLGKQVGRVGLTRDVLDDNTLGATELAHLEQLTVDVTRVLGRREPMTQVISGFAIC